MAAFETSATTAAKAATDDFLLIGLDGIGIGRKSHVSASELAPVATASS
jgi:hypothetical protein